MRFRVIGGNPMTLWVSSFSPRIIELYGSGKVVRGLRVARVEYLVDGEAVGVVEGDPTQPWDLTQRFEHRHTFERTGARELRVRVGFAEVSLEMRAPPAEENRGVTCSPDFGPSVMSESSRRSLPMSRKSKHTAASRCDSALRRARSRSSSCA